MSEVPCDTTILAEGLLFPEGPRWRDGKLYFSDIHDRAVKTCDLDGAVEVVVAMPPPHRPSGLGFMPNGDLLIVAQPYSVMRLGADGELTTVADLEGLAPANCNDMVVDARGRAYIGSVGYNFRDPSVTPVPAPLVLLPPDGPPRIVAEGLGFPNGAVITPDGRTLIVGETNAAQFTAFTIEEDGSLSNRRIWARFDDQGFTSANRATRKRPDGCALDAEGAIWFASPGMDKVFRAREGGEITHTLTPSQPVYACMLGGPDRRTLFVLTARTHMIEEAIAARSGRIETIPVDVPGAGIP